MNPSPASPGPDPLRRLRRWRRLALLLGVSLVVGAAFEARLLPRLREKLSPPVWRWTRPDPAALAVIQAGTRRQLDALAPATPTGLSSRSRLEEALSANRKSSAVNRWPNACLAAGLLATMQAGPGDPETQAVLQRFGDRLVAADGRLREPLRSVEQAMIGPLLLDLSKRPGGERFGKASTQLATFLMSGTAHSRTGTLPYDPERPETMLADTLAFACPFLAGYARDFAQPAAAALAVRQLVEFTDRAIEPTSGLPWHAYDSGTGAGYGALGWTRGTGWYAVALAETLAALPEGDPAHARIAELLRRLYGSVAPRQQPDGLWRWCLSVPDGGEDTSGSALLVWAFERGAVAGALPVEAASVTAKGLEGIVRRTDQRGVVGQALGECQAVGHYPRVFGAYPWAQGPATAALAWSRAPSAPRLP